MRDFPSILLILSNSFFVLFVSSWFNYSLLPLSAFG